MPTFAPLGLPNFTLLAACPVHLAKLGLIVRYRAELSANLLMRTSPTGLAGLI